MHAPTLARWVGDTETFLASYWNRLPGVFDPPDRDLSPFTLADADGALSSGLLREPYIEMTNASTPLAADAYTTTRQVSRTAHAGFADPARIGALLEQGATLLLRNIDQWHPPTAAMLGALSGELGRPIEAFYFVTPAGHQGLPLHRDDADVLVFQVAGSKSWRVHEGPGDAAWGPGSVLEDGPQPAEVLRTTLRQGQVLYIPRGFAHQAVGDGGLSVHLSLTVREAGTVELHRALQRLLFAGLRLAPRPLGEDALLAVAEQLLDHTRRSLAELTPRDLLDRARHRDTAPPAPPRLTLAAAAQVWADRDSTP
ncbi:cupin [Streptacidiphilus sp. PB12-B1b]|uniref:JmjC domain-containing protein n=1 Tax=Streptacidiphilus sp. PB12-B1b TaxID=2705012 RepID=UPI0015F82D77|nr:cupin domain-containing protein [Streptacidiphilus sp. PB12-B1b]QMU78222.1 cupin [Streptacidiphilus sp. PB12-B1b]